MRINKYQILHFLAGVLTSISAVKLPTLSGCMFAGFMIYELVEYMIKRDEYIIDVRSYLVGVYLTFVLEVVLGWIRIP